jgi:glycosyltransferase involved in cell wall biosynthesis
LRRLEQIGVRNEVIIVDDGSEDGGRTREVAGKLGCTYLENPVNLGKGAAVRRGMRHASGRYRLYTDIDVPYELSAIDSFLYYLDTKEYDIVAGDRNLEESSYFHQLSLARRMASRVYSTFLGRLVTGGWYDTQCGLKGFRGEVADDLFGVTRINRFAFDVELLYVALKRNYDIKRLPVRLRVNETSTVSVVLDGSAMVRDLGVILFNQRVGRYRPLTRPHRGIDRMPRPFVWASDRREDPERR